MRRRLPSSDGRRSIRQRCSAAAAGLVVGLIAGCSGSTMPQQYSATTPASTATAATTAPSPSGSLAAGSAAPEALAPNRYEQLLLDDGARGLWPLRDVRPGLRFGDTLADLSSPLTPALDVDGLITPTQGPTLLGTSVGAAAFTARGRIATPLQTGFTSRDAFTIETWFRADGCSNSWGRAAGTETAGVGGREGVSLFFYPKIARQPCRLGVEVWHRNSYVLGCPSGISAPARTWVHIAATYRQGTLTCYRNGVVSERQTRAAGVFEQSGPFDIGSAGTGITGNLSSGSLAQVAVYASALPAARIAAHAKAAS